MRKIIFGIRKSSLAARQLDEFIAHMGSMKIHFKCEVLAISTGADKKPEAAISDLGVGIFTKELERALLSGEIDCAVHSLKDVPVGIGSGTVLSCFTPRADARDCVVWSPGRSAGGGLKGLRVATGSPRRAAFIRDIEPDIEVMPLRGNVDTRLRKCEAGEFDAMVLAACGLKRLGREDRIGLYLEPDEFVPAAGQGIVCAQTRFDDGELNSVLERASSQETEKAALCERAVIESLGIGCRAAFGVFARFTKDGFSITAKSHSDKTGRYLSHRSGGPAKEHKKLTQELIDFMRREMGK
jgi:hydroxymethylbilane synthase